MATDQFPDHIKCLIQKMKKEAEVTKQHREKEKCMCKIRTVLHHPKEGKKVQTLEVDRSETLEEANKKAYQVGYSAFCV